MHSVVAEEIGRKLDAFATEVVLAAGEPVATERWAESLAMLAELAHASKNDSAASIAAGLAGSLRANSGGQSDEQLRLELTNGLERLRVALDSAEAGPDESAAAFNLADDPELIRDFVNESREHLDSIEVQVLTLERDALNMEAVHSVFRSFHTIKGLAGFLGFEVMQRLAHEVETVLDLARNSQLTVTASIIDLVLESRDYLASWLCCLDAAGAGAAMTPPPVDQALLNRIQQVIEFGAVATVEPTVIATVPTATPVSTIPDPVASAGEPQVSPAPVDAQIPATPAAAATQTKTATRSVKVDTEKLDYLVDMVGEMVIAQSLVRHDPDLKIDGNGRLGRNLSQLARITDEVQRTAMAMRMVPVGPLFQKMVRLVRDLARKFGKQIQVETEGEDVDLDRNIVEELADPLMHMIRNAVDHGVDTAEERMAAGKDATATIRMRAAHRSGHIVIEVSDDGRGINRKKVLERARKNGIIGPSAQLSDAECQNLIFQPGFSTADRVSDVSGRGVGMDVVRKQILKLRGSVEVDSVEGRGAIFSLRLPLTLAIIDGLVVVTGEERYIIPLTSIKELFRPGDGQVTTVEGRAEVVAVRERLYPVIRLYEKFQIEPRTKDVLDSVFVMAEVDGTCFCVMVDDLIGKQEVVIKSLGTPFRNVPGVAGGAILGDGHVGLILDLHTLFAGNDND